MKATGRKNLRGLSKRITQRCTVTRTDTLGVLDALLEVLPEELANGNIVDLGEVGSFWLRNSATGVDEEDKVSAKQVTNLLVRFFPGRELKKALASVRFVKARRRRR